MIYALRNKATGELLACTQVNGYRLPYYGILQWESQPQEAAAAAALTRAGLTESPAEDWEPIELSEHQAKMANVKLRNDAKRQVFMLDGAITAQ